MRPQDIATLITAMASALGIAWTVFNGRRQSRHDDAAILWQEAMDVIDRLKEENEDLKDQVWHLQHPTVRPGRQRPALPKRTEPRQS